MLVLLDEGVGQIGVYRRSHIAGQCPWRGRPHQQAFAGAVAQRKAQEDAGVCQFTVPISYDFVLANTCVTSRTPGHHVGAFVDIALVKALPEHPPDCVIIFI